jgi:hypothetical protein
MYLSTNRPPKVSFSSRFGPFAPKQENPNIDRRRFLGSTAMALAANLLGSTANAQSNADNDRRMILASAPPSEIQTLIETHVKGFNTQNSQLFWGDSSSRQSAPELTVRVWRGSQTKRLLRL